MAYVTKGRKLLVFSHPRALDAGIQVPAGTIEPSEAPEQAVLREAREETGLASLKILLFLGARDFEFAAYGRDEIHRRHFFHLEAAGDAPQRWRHFERHPSEDVTEPIEFELFWVRFPDEVPELIAGLGDLLHLVDWPDK